MKHGKKYVEASKLYDKQTQYDRDEAVAIVKKLATAKFDETIEAHIRTGCDGRHADQQIRGGMILNTDPDHYYISYAGVDGVTDGTVIVSYMVYSTKNNSIDDIEERCDYIASREYEQEVWM